MSQRKQLGKRRVTHKRLTVDDNFVDSAANGQMRHTPAFAGFMAQRDKSNLNDNIGVQCRLVEFIVGRNQHMHDQIRQDGITGKGRYLSSEASAILSNSLPVHLSGNEALIPAVPAFVRMAFDDVVAKEVWYSAGADGAGQVGRLFDEAVPQTSLGLPIDSTDTSALTTSTNIRPFDPSCEGIRIPVLGQCSDPARLASLLHSKLLLGYAPSDGHSSLPQRVTITTNPDRYSTFEISALVTFNESKNFDDPLVQAAVQAIKGLNESLYLGEGKTVVLGEPQIVRFATATTKQQSDAPLPAPTFDSETLPDLDYSLVLRNVTAPTGLVADRLTLLATHGFVNYTDTSRYQNHLARASRQGHRLVNREFDDFIKVHLRTLTEGYAPLDRVLTEAFEDMKVDFGDGGGGSMLSEAGRYNPNLEQAAAARRRHNPWMHLERRVGPKAQELIHILTTDHKELGFTADHPKQLLEIIGMGAGNSQDRKRDGRPTDSRSMAYRDAAALDPAKLLREAIHRHVLLDSMSALSDVHWNSYASLRLKVLGAAVAVGDIVATNKEQRFDYGACDVPRDSIPSQKDQYIPRWGHHLGHLQSPPEELFATGVLKRVESAQEARQYQLTDVVLPKIGRVLTDKELVYPSHRVGKGAFDELAGRLKVGPAAAMKLAPWATYRRLIERPMLIADTNTDGTSSLKYAMWNDGRGIMEDPHGLVPKLLITDHDKLRRIRTPHEGAAPHIMRRSMKIVESREAMLSIASGGLSVLLQCRLRRGVSLNSMLREPFSPKTLFAERLWALGMGPRAATEATKPKVAGGFMSYSKAKKLERK